MRVPLLASLILTTVAAAAAPAFADDPTYTYGKKDDVKDVNDVTWTGKVEAGVVATTGNSRTTTATGSATAIRKDKDNKFEGNITGTFARATTRVVTDANMNMLIDPGEVSEQSATSAENVAAKLRYDRYLTDLNSLYIAALGLVDKPAGKAFQGGGQIGYSRSLYKTERAEATAELGYDLSYLKVANDGSTTIHSARVYVGYKGKVATDSVLEASLESLFNLNKVTIAAREASAFEATRLNGVVGLTTNLTKTMSFSVSFTARYDNFPAPIAEIANLKFAPGYELVADKLDTISKASLILTF
jgi:putative salt-induced outer membrane protein YdiY